MFSTGQANLASCRIMPYFTEQTWLMECFSAQLDFAEHFTL